MTPRKSSPAMRKERKPVPLDLRLALARLDARVGRRKACALVGVGPALFEELITPNNIAQPAVIERVMAAVAPHMEVA